MSMTYLFVPFTTAEGNDQLKGMAYQWMAAMAGDVRRKGPVIVVTPDVDRPNLSAASYDEKIYILAHGSDSQVAAEYVFNEPTSPARGINMAGVADRLQQSGLRYHHKVLKLYVCAEVWDATRQLATDLHAALKAKNYIRIEVQYYTASVSGPMPRGDDTFSKSAIIGTMKRGDGSVPLTTRAKNTRQSIR